MYTHTTSIFVGVNFYGLMLVDVETESEKWNFLKYGRIGNTLCNPYIQGTVVPCDIRRAVVLYRYNVNHMKYKAELCAIIHPVFKKIKLPIKNNMPNDT